MRGLGDPPILESSHANGGLPGEGEGSKARIMAEAVRLFAKKGYEASSVREIVEAAGVTKPVLYYYFKNKEDLFRQIVAEAMRQFHDDLLGAMQRECASLGERLRAIQDIYAESARTKRDLVKFIHAVAFSDLYDEIFDFDAEWARLLEAIAAMFREAQAAGQASDRQDPMVQAILFVSAAMELMRVLVYKPDILDFMPFEEQLVSTMLEGIAPSARQEKHRQEEQTPCGQGARAEEPAPARKPERLGE
ncbi:MAG: HTH-type transcriptional regulator TtgR [candidate division BRC1 bacterium ADurb.BinA364]|nr:MAG: HTH-type transcriptional regulator TtgR [candidate division BRC1 bacterium ADurb.BinA364]